MQIFKRSNGKPKSFRERGQVLVEFSLVATVFFAFLFGIFDFARMFQSWITVQHSARESARYAITGRTDCDGVTSDRLACVVQAAEDGTLGLPNGGIGSDLVDVTVTYWEYPNYADPAETGAGGPCDTIEVEIEYQHHFITPLVKPVMSVLGTDPIVLRGTQRMTNEPWGGCSAPAESTGPSPPTGGGPAPPGSI